MKRQMRRKLERGGPRPLHKSFSDYVITNRAMRRDIRLINRMLKERQDAGDGAGYNRIVAEMELAATHRSSAR